LDNEFELVFVAGYQKVLKLSYVDKFLDDMHLEIRDRYKNILLDKRAFLRGIDLGDLYGELLRAAEIWSFEMANQPKTMRTYEQSKKSMKTVSSMIEKSPGSNANGDSNKKPKKPKAPSAPMKAVIPDVNENNEDDDSDEVEVDQSASADNDVDDLAGPGPSPPGGMGRTVMKGPGGRRTVKTA